MNGGSPEPVLPSYGEFARMLYRTAILSDPWLYGQERFSLRGKVLSREQADQLVVAAERIAFLHHELATIVWNDRALLDDFFELTPFQKAMWLASEGRWHGIARVDLFLCEDGRIRTCEMNSDTPSGEAEAVILNRLLHEFHPGTNDENQAIEESFVEMVFESWRASQTASAARTPAALSIALIYPTDLPEDLSMIALYRDWFEKRGHRVVLGSPFNLTFDAEGCVLVLGEKIDIIVRHYKTDWWGEREPIWKDQPPFPDAEPLDEQLLPLLEAEQKGKITVINPFGAILLQNKKSLAFMWEHRRRFTEKAQQWIQDLIPETRRFTSLEAAELKQAEWVVKSAYGCEGDSVYCGAFVKPREWRSILARVEGRHWVWQRFFEVQRELDGQLANIGAYVIGGSACGFYTRLSTAGTDYTAVTAPTYVRGA